MQISVVQISVMQNYPQDNPLLKQKTHLTVRLIRQIIAIPRKQDLRNLLLD